MIEKELVVKDEVGLHARPASLFVKLAQEFNGTVAVRFPKVNKETGEVEVVEKDGKSMIGILSLGIAKDKPFTLVLDGVDEESYLIRFEQLLEIMSSVLETLLNSSKVQESEQWDALYDSLPVVVAESTKELSDALSRLDQVGGYGFIATWRKNLFAFNPKLISKRCGLIDENGNLLKAARVPKN